MKTFKNIPKIGEGIYLIPDIAEILGLSYSKVNNWSHEFWSSKTFGEKGNKAINFLTLIEFYTFYKLREEGLSAQKIKKIHSLVAKELKTNYPFARAVSTDGKDVWYHYVNEIIKADGKQQIDFKKILAPFLHNIDFGKNHIAERYFPRGRTHTIVVDPKYQFGQPIISGKGIKVQVIRDLIESGEPKDNICYIYDLNIQQVNSVVKYYGMRGAA